MKITSLSLTGCGGLVSVGPFPKTSNVSKEIRDAAFEKFAAQNRTFREKHRSANNFVLVYPDGSLVDKLPGSQEDFSLIGYRNSIDPHKRFDRLRLYICRKSKSLLNIIQPHAVSDMNIIVLVNREHSYLVYLHVFQMITVCINRVK